MDFMKEALVEADKAYKLNNVPVGAVIVMNNEIIARSFNDRINDYDVTSHAEITAIRNAEKVLKDWRLDGCDLYVTLEPCDMCIEVIKAARISNVYYLLDRLDYKKKFNKTNICSVCEDDSILEEYKGKLSTFFKHNCNR